MQGGRRAWRPLTRTDRQGETPCRRSLGRGSRLHVAAIDKVRLGLTVDHGLVDDDLAHVLERRQIEHRIEQHLLQDRAQTAIARKALARKTGARGLRTILEQVLLDTMFDLPSLEHVSKVVVDEAVINGQAEPYLIYRGNMQTRAASE